MVQLACPCSASLAPQPPAAGSIHDHTRVRHDSKVHCGTCSWGFEPHRYRWRTLSPGYRWSYIWSWH